MSKYEGGPDRQDLGESQGTKHCRLETRYYTTKLERPSEQEIRDERSRPFGQYDAQWLRECDRIRYQLISRSGGRKETLPFDPELSEVEVVKNAHENVENRWIKQGIWDENWLKDEPEWLRYLVPPPPMKTWRHERYGGESETEKSDFLASRPYHQFIYQVSRERKWLKDEEL